MNFCTHPSSSSSYSSSASFGIWVCRLKNICSSVVSAALGDFLSAIFIFFFAVVGSTLGAITGAMIGQETESGFFRGASIGAISGAVFSIQVFESSLDLWHSDDTGIGCLLYLIDVIANLLNGRLVREQVGPAMLSAVNSQMSETEINFDEVSDMFGTAGVKGLSGDSVEKIPKINITNKNNVDASGDWVSCSVCLQWLIKHGSCPLCRRDL